MCETKILGLDLGTNSIGWAITRQTEAGYELLDKGVDIFQEGVNRTQSGEEPTVKKRTEARASRRHYFRRRLRKIELLKILVENGMCPPLSHEQLDEWRYNRHYPMDDAFLNWQRTDDNRDKNPYYYRYVALTSSLDLSKQTDRYMLGRALYHLSQRRGFLSNRKEQTDDKESGAVKTDIGKLTDDMRQRGCTYLGEYFYKLYRTGEKIRTKHTSRKEHYEKEFNAICQRQQLPESLVKSLHRAIFFQRELKSQKGLVGSCTFEKGKPRCPISHPRFEEFRMLAFLNNVKIQTPGDAELRPLLQEEREAVIPLFLRKSKADFNFEDIAKKLSGGRKNMYSYYLDKNETPYRFNFKMITSVSGAPVSAALKSIFGDDWRTEMCSLYVKGAGKSKEQILNDVWHALFSFTDDDKLHKWAVDNLQLTDEQADDFVKIRMKQGYASLSLNAISKILPYLRTGLRYDEAVFLANLPAVAGTELWRDRRQEIERDVCEILDDYAGNPTNRGLTKEQCITDMLLDKYGIPKNRSARLYHPSKVKIFKDVIPNTDGVVLLGSPRTSSVRNPMAMRALFRLRALVNTLLREGCIDKNTKINIEFARGLNDANMRAAIERYNREQEANRKKYAETIRELYYTETGRDITPSESNIMKYQLWEEQKHICLYTGKTISLSEFIGDNPSFDIEHTVPRSRGGDNSHMNMTLCDSHYNRFVKVGNLPSELADHDAIMVRIEEIGWAKQIEQYNRQIEARKKINNSTKELKDKTIQEKHYLRMKRDYLAGKLQRFTMTEVPECFSNRQGVDIGIIGRYARMYLQTVFDRVYTVKGATTADFRKMWGLQEDYSKKERVNHVHHCIDAITIACIGSGAYAKWAQFQRDTERYYWHRDMKPQVEKPWPTFTEDVKAVADSLLVSHHTADNMPKQMKKKMRIRGRVQHNETGAVKYLQGDTARGALHQETFYGAIKRDDEIKYVVRKSLASLQLSDVPKIVDDAIRRCVEEAVKREGFKEAMSKPICFNAEKGVYIKKVRVFTPSITQPIKLKRHRDVSHFEYKQNYHVANDGNYCMAIYEGTDEKWRTKRDFEIRTNLHAAKYFNGKINDYDLVPQSSRNDYPLKYILRTGTMVLFYENSPEELYECSYAELSKRLYKLTKFSSMQQGNNRYGTLVFRHHQEARPAGELKAKNGRWKIGEDYRPLIGLLHTQLNMYVEGYDFELTVTGDIKFKH